MKRRRFDSDASVQCSHVSDERKDDSNTGTNPMQTKRNKSDSEQSDTFYSPSMDATSSNALSFADFDLEVPVMFYVSLLLFIFIISKNNNLNRNPF